VLRRARPGDGVAFFAPYVRYPFDYYALRQPRVLPTLRPIYPSTPWGGLTGLDSLSAVSERAWLGDRAPGSADVWLVVSHETYPAGAQLEPHWLRPPPAGSYCPVAEQSFERVRVVRLSRCARPVLSAR
jgi:hypothetical protein